MQTLRYTRGGTVPSGWPDPQVHIQVAHWPRQPAAYCYCAGRPHQSAYNFYSDNYRKLNPSGSASPQFQVEPTGRSGRGTSPMLSRISFAVVSGVKSVTSAQSLPSTLATFKPGYRHGDIPVRIPDGIRLTRHNNRVRSVFFATHMVRYNGTSKDTASAPSGSLQGTAPSFRPYFLMRSP